LLVQTALGWLFRAIQSSHGEKAALGYFRRLVRLSPAELERDSQTLQKILGENYTVRYEALVNVIDQTELSNIQTLASGRNGRVQSALWNQGLMFESEATEPISIVLKNVVIDLNSGGSGVVTKFLKEVALPLLTNLN